MLIKVGQFTWHRYPTAIKAATTELTQTLSVRVAVETISKHSAKDNNVYANSSTSSVLHDFRNGNDKLQHSAKNVDFAA